METPNACGCGHYGPTLEHWRGGYAAYCRECGWRTEDVGSQEEAIRLWNTRKGEKA